MPVVGTPVAQPAITTAQAQSQALVAPTVAQMDGQDTPARRQAVEVRQGEKKTIQWTLRTPNGDPIDITANGFSSSQSSSSGESGEEVILRIAEAARTAETPIAITATVVSAANGVVEARLTEEAVKVAGVYLLQWDVTDSLGDTVFSNQGYLVVSRGLNSDDRRRGPPSPAEIRLHMRDSGAEDNYLLDSVEFDLAELAACSERAVQIWNDTMDYVGPRYTTSTFPYRTQWLDCIVGSLYLLAAQNYRRNFQQFTAAGTAMNDKAKAQEYEVIGRDMIKQFRSFVVQRKNTTNAMAAFGSAGGRYDRRWW